MAVFFSSVSIKKECVMLNILLFIHQERVKKKKKNLEIFQIWSETTHPPL